MNPLVNRHSNPVEGSQPRAGDAPMQLPPLAEESAQAHGADDTSSRYKGDLFLPGWLKIELEPSADQGPGAA